MSEFKIGPLNHVGVAVPDIEEAMETFQRFGGFIHEQALIETTPPGYGQPGGRAPGSAAPASEAPPQPQPQRRRRR